MAAKKKNVRKSRKPKEFERLTDEQLKNIVFYAVSFPDELRQMRESFDKKRKNLGPILQNLPVWSHLYDFPFNQCVGILLKTLTLEDVVKEACESPDIQQEIIDSLPNFPRNPFEMPGVTPADLAQYIAAMMALIYSIQSMRFHSRSLNDLIAKSRNGDDKSLFKVLRIDRTAVATPSITKRLVRAQELNEVGFLKKFASALEVRKIPREPASHDDLRVVLAILEETVGLKRIAPKRLYELMVRQYKLFPTRGEPDVLEAFRKFVSRFKETRKT